MQVPEIFRTIANLQEGEKIIGIGAYAGDDREETFPQLALVVRARLDIDANTLTPTGQSQIDVLRCGWILKPAPDTEPGIHSQPIGELWVVYKDLPCEKNVGLPSETLGQEDHETCKSRAKAIESLLNDQSTTRPELVAVLRQLADEIELAARFDAALRK